MIAGKMKLKYFALIVGVIGVIAFTAMYFQCASQDEVITSEKPKPPPKLVEAQSPLPAPQPAAAPPDGPSERPVDQAIMRYAGKSLGSDKIKDATKGRPYKVNLYQDAGKSTMNRAKVDLDRDDKWDEKWTFDGDAITRQVAPNDDDNYTETYMWDGNAWAKQ
jgi:hypothetical protein